MLVPSGPVLTGARRIAGPLDVRNHARGFSVLRVPSIPAVSAAPARAYTFVTYAAATVEAPAATAAASGAPEDDDGSSQQQQPPQQQQQQRRKGDKMDKPIVVGDKPAANSLIKRLELAPQTLVRAQTSSEAHTYKTITTIAAAQRALSQPGKLLLYVPFTKSSAFTAIVLPASDAVEQKAASMPRLTVKASTDPKDLANTLTYDLVKHGSAVVLSAGAAATARAAEALGAVRQQLLGRGYEVGVLPRFQEGPGSEASITVLSQQVVLQELPVPRVTLPRNPGKTLDTAAGVAKTVLQKQRRVQLLLPPSQIGRLSSMLSRVMQPAQPDKEKEKLARDTRGGKGLRSPAAAKKRLLVVWPPSTADQLLESLEQLSHFTTSALQQPPAAATAATVDASAAPTAAAASSEALALDAALLPVAAELPVAAAAAPAVMEEPTLQLQLRRSRLTSIPPPQQGPSGPREDRKPAVATAESSVTGLAGAIEARVSRAGVVWVRSDGSAKGNATAWDALFLASNKMDAADGAGGLLALVDVQSPTQQQQQRGKPAAAAAEDEPVQEQQQQEGAEQQQQPAAAAGAAGARRRQRGRQQRQQQVEDEPPQRLQMLVVRDTEIARSILQAPNAPLEVSVSVDLWPLLKFATAANSFLPVSAATGAGGLLLLPAVLPVPEPTTVATDYRFEDQKQQLVPYSIRLQRFTGELPQGMEVDDSQQLRVSLSTDPIKLRDAIVAKVLQQQPASVRFVGPQGRSPPLMTIAMAAVAAARVRLQQKGAGLDVGVMPYAETLRQSTAASEEGDAAAAAAAGGGGAAAERGRRAGGRGGRRLQGAAGAGGAQTGRVVYSLRLVPLPAAGAAAVGDAAPAAAAGSAESSTEE